MAVVVAAMMIGLPLPTQAQSFPVGGVEKAYVCSNYASNEGGGTLWQDIELCRQCGTCKIEDFVRLAVNITDFILGIVGSLALLMLVYGGVVWIISGGSADKVQQGKTIVRNAIIGLVLVFTSWLIVSVVVRAFSCAGDNATSNACTTGTIFDRPWDQSP